MSVLRFFQSAFLLLAIVSGTALAQSAQIPPPTDEIFVTNERDSLMAYPLRASGNVAPQWMMGRKLTPFGIATDSAGKLYVTNYWLDSVSVFAPGAAGATSPAAVIRGSSTQLEYPTGIAVDPQGRIYVVNGAGELSEGPGSGTGRIDIYAPGSNGNVAPSSVIEGPRTRIENPKAIAIDAKGKIYVADLGSGESSPPRILIFSPGSNGNTAPEAVISGDKTELHWSDGIAVDAKGKIYVANHGSFLRGLDSITIYSPGTIGNSDPESTISVDNALNGPQGIAVDSGGRVYVTNDIDLSIAIFEPRADGTFSAVARPNASKQTKSLRASQFRPRGWCTWPYAIFRNQAGSTSTLQAETILNHWPQ